MKSEKKLKRGLRVQLCNKYRMGKYPKRLVGCLLKKAEVRIVFIYQGWTGELFLQGRARPKIYGAGRRRGLILLGGVGSGRGTFCVNQLIDVICYTMEP